VEKGEFFSLIEGGWEECLWEEKIYFSFPKGNFFGWHGEREVWFFVKEEKRWAKAFQNMLNY
jgi:hypothetical protein